jgi:hypothetical protein
MLYLLISFYKFQQYLLASGFHSYRVITAGYVKIYKSTKNCSLFQAPSGYIMLCLNFDLRFARKQSTGRTITLVICRLVADLCCSRILVFLCVFLLSKSVESDNVIYVLFVSKCPLFRLTRQLALF